MPGMGVDKECLNLLHCLLLAALTWKLTGKAGGFVHKSYWSSKVSARTKQILHHTSPCPLWLLGFGKTSYWAYSKFQLTTGHCDLPWLYCYFCPVCDK
jgi:hypothetical protein